MFSTPCRAKTVSRTWPQYCSGVTQAGPCRASRGMVSRNLKHVCRSRRNRRKKNSHGQSISVRWMSWYFKSQLARAVDRSGFAWQRSTATSSCLRSSPDDHGGSPTLPGGLARLSSGLRETLPGERMAKVKEIDLGRRRRGERSGSARRILSSRPGGIVFPGVGWGFRKTYEALATVATLLLRNVNTLRCIRSASIESLFLFRQISSQNGPMRRIASAITSRGWIHPQRRLRWRKPSGTSLSSDNKRRSRGQAGNASVWKDRSPEGVLHCQH